MEQISCLETLCCAHQELVRTIPDAQTILKWCAQLESNQGISSQRLTNAMQNCDPAEFDKVWPGEEHIINIGQCCSFAPLDTSDVGRMAQKLTLFPDNFMERLRILVERVRSPPQLSYGNLISNFPIAVYLCLFQKIAKDEATTIVKMSAKGSETCQLVLTVPGVIQHHQEWSVITRQWSREIVNKEKTNDDTDTLINMLAPKVERFDVRSVFGSNHLHEFLSTKLKILMSKKIAASWLSFSGSGNTLGSTQTQHSSSSGLDNWKYGEVTPFEEIKATVKIRLVMTLIEGNPRKLMCFFPSHSLRDLKATIEKQLREHGLGPCDFSLYSGFPSSIVEVDDSTTLESFHNTVVTVRSK